MGIVYSCPHCRTQNFATEARMRSAERFPLQCWKCGREIRKSLVPKPLLKKKGKIARKKITPWGQ